MLASNKLTPALTLVLISVASFTACLPKQSNDGSASGRRNVVQAGQTNGANTSTNSSPSTQSPPISSPSVQNPPAQNSECYKGDAFFCKVEQIISEKTNKYRAGRGLQPLKLDSKISFVARDWSQKQSSSGSISHRGFPSSRASVYRSEFGRSQNISGENVAYTSGVSGSSRRDDAAAEAIAEEFAVMWWNSSGHRRNMLGSFSSIGVGLAQRSNGAWYATQIFN